MESFCGENDEVAWNRKWDMPLLLAEGGAHVRTATGDRFTTFGLGTVINRL